MLSFPWLNSIFGNFRSISLVRWILRQQTDLSPRASLSLSRVQVCPAGTTRSRRQWWPVNLPLWMSELRMSSPQAESPGPPIFPSQRWLFTIKTPVFICLSRWSMPSVCLRRSFRPSMEWANHPRTRPSSRPARLEVGQPRWETNSTRWDTTWWRPTQGLWPNGSRWVEKWKNKGCDYHYDITVNCPTSFDQKYPDRGRFLWPITSWRFKTNFDSFMLWSREEATCYVNEEFLSNFC